MLIAAVLLLGAGQASAANRYAEPGLGGSDLACPMSDPCDLEEAVNLAATGDDVTVLPGAYSISNQLVMPGPGGITLHGLSAGQRPEIASTYPGSNGAILVRGTLQDIQIEATAGAATVSIDSPSALVERVYARNSIVGGRACELEGTVRDSVCWASGTGGIGARLGVGPGFTRTATLRNVTAIGGDAGLEAGAGGISATATLTATNVIADGGNVDVRASQTGMGTTATANLDYSNYATESEVGGATVTNPGASNNVTTPTPVFVDASNGDFRQTSGSSGTIDLGTATGLVMGELDVDGQSRTLDAGPDIGADEFGHPTTTSVLCALPSVMLGGGSVTCGAFVDDTASGPNPPSGNVDFGSSDPGTFTGAGSCTLAPLFPPTTGTCSLDYTPTAVGSGTHVITATYAGDASHDPSQATAQITVTAPPMPPVTPTPGTTPSTLAATPVPARRCRKGFRLKKVRGKKKCVRKRRG